MNRGKLVFSHVTQHVPLTTFRRSVARYGGEHKVKSFSWLEQFLCMAFAQLTIARACPTATRACAHKRARCTTWVSRAGFRAAR